jgi:hypothetical protein
LIALGLLAGDARPRRIIMGMFDRPLSAAMLVGMALAVTWAPGLSLADDDNDNVSQQKSKPNLQTAVETTGPTPPVSPATRVTVRPGLTVQPGVTLRPSGQTGNVVVYVVKGGTTGLPGTASEEDCQDHVSVLNQFYDQLENVLLNDPNNGPLMTAISNAIDAREDTALNEGCYLTYGPE